MPLRPAIAATVLAASAAVPASGVAHAAPTVAVDIAPVHSLVARVMAGVGEPTLIVPPDASPHGYAMRPSEARTLQDADLVVWIGEALTPWLGAAIATLAGDAPRVTLMDVDGVRVLDLAGEGHDDHGEHGEEHGHEHGDHDPHAWLDPANAAVWVDALADALAEADPANAETYRANAAAARAEMTALDDEIAEGFRGETGAPGYVVFHDAYRYFETAYGVPAAAAIALSDAARPGPARLRAVQDAIAAEDVACVLVEPQFDAALADTVVEGTGARVEVIDPLGARLETGPDLYPRLLRDLADRIGACR